MNQKTKEKLARLWPVTILIAYAMIGYLFVEVREHTAQPKHVGTLATEVIEAKQTALQHSIDELREDLRSLTTLKEEVQQIQEAQTTLKEEFERKQ